MNVLHPTDHSEIFMPWAKNNNKECKDPKNVQLKKGEFVHIKP